MLLFDEATVHTKCIEREWPTTKLHSKLYMRDSKLDIHLVSQPHHNHFVIDQATVIWNVTVSGLKDVFTMWKLRTQPANKLKQVKA